jgi:hypothetical protein
MNVMKKENQMPKIKTESRLTTNDSRLTNWLFSAPLKYTGLVTILTAALILITNFAFPPMSQIAPLFAVIALFAILIFSTYKILRWTADAPLDQKSFVMLGIAQALVGIIAAIVLGVCSLNVQNLVAMNTGYMITALIALLLMVFLFGVWMLQIKAIFCRARALGVAKWKLWLSVPFGIWLFWYPGFLINDAKKKPAAIPTKSNWLNNIGNWIVERPRNTAIAFLAMVAFHLIFMAGDFIGTLLFLGMSLIMMALIMLCKRVRENIGGIFANMLMILNIVLVVLIALVVSR